MFLNLFCFCVAVNQFQDKSGNKWSERDNFKKKAGKYDLIEMGNEEEEEEEARIHFQEIIFLILRFLFFHIVWL